MVGVKVAKADAEVFYEMSGSLPENVNFGIKVETVRPFVKAYNIGINSWFFSSGKALTSVEIA